MVYSSRKRRGTGVHTQVYTEEPTCGPVKTVSPRPGPRLTQVSWLWCPPPLSPYADSWSLMTADVIVLEFRTPQWPQVPSSGQAHTPACSSLTVPQPACVPTRASARRDSREPPRWASPCQGQKASGEKMSEVSVIKQSSLFLHGSCLWVTPQTPKVRAPRGSLLNFFTALGVACRPFVSRVWDKRQHQCGGHSHRAGVGGSGQLTQDGLLQICSLVEKTLSM